MKHVHIHETRYALSCEHNLSAREKNKNTFNTSVMRISIPLDLSSRSFIPLSRFICSRRPTPLCHASSPFPRPFSSAFCGTCRVFIFALRLVLFSFPVSSRSVSATFSPLPFLFGNKPSNTHLNCADGVCAREALFCSAHDVGSCAGAGTGAGAERSNEG